MYSTTDRPIIRLRGIHAGIHPLSLKIDPAVIEVRDAIAAINVDGTLEADGESYTVRIVIRGMLHHSCDRCAREFDATYEVPITIKYSPQPPDEHPEAGSYTHEYDASSPAEVDLCEDIHDALLLAVPMKKLCSADCKGLLPTLDVTPVVDERFASLSSLRDKLREEESPSP